MSSSSSSPRMVTILLKSTGLSSEFQGAKLGEYVREETLANTSVTYIQRHSVNSTCHYLYRLLDGTWGVSDTPGASQSLALHNPSNTEELPLSGWWCRVGSQLRDDPNLLITSISSKPCSLIKIDVKKRGRREMSEFVGNFQALGFPETFKK